MSYRHGSVPSHLRPARRLGTPRQACRSCGVWAAGSLSLDPSAGGDLRRGELHAPAPARPRPPRPGPGASLLCVHPTRRAVAWAMQAHPREAPGESRRREMRCDHTAGGVTSVRTPRRSSATELTATVAVATPIRMRRPSDSRPSTVLHAVSVPTSICIQCTHRTAHSSQPSASLHCPPPHRHR